MLNHNAFKYSFHELVREFMNTRDASLIPALMAELGALQNYRLEPNAPNEAYSRSVLYSTPELEIMVACWRQNQECLPHDHGFSEGCVVNLQGRFVETSYSWEKQKLVTSGTWNHDQVLSIMDIGTSDIHSMHCVDPVGLTLHMYSPAINNMKVFDRNQERTLVVANNCGSWIPSDRSLILSESFWTEN